MTSTPALDISSAYAVSSPSAQDKIPASTLDSDHAAIEAWATRLLTDIGRVIRSDDTLVDEIVRLRNLHPEVVEALEGLTVLAAAAACSTSNQAALAGLLTIDGYTLLVGDRVLLVGQTNAIQNGIWVASAGAWTRASDYATGSSQVANTVLDVLNGTAQTGSTWRLVSAITVDSSTETWNQLSGIGSVVAISRGGTGATTAATARTALGISTAMDQVVIAATLALARAAMGPWGDALVTSTGGTTARSLAARFATGTRNVLDFGAVGDGVTDDTAAILAAIAAATAGQSIYFPSGSYLTTGIAIAKSLTLFGDGYGSKLIASGAATRIFNITAATANGMVIRDLNFLGDRTNETGDQFGILVNDGTHKGKIHNCWFGGTTGSTGLHTQIDIVNCNHWEVRDNNLSQVIGTNSGWGYGILMPGCKYCVISNNISVQTSTNGRHHIYISAGASSNSVTGNRTYGGKSAAISVYSTDAQDWGEGNIISGNSCIDCASVAALEGAIVIVQKSRNNIVSNNVVTGCGTHGILIQGGTGVSDSRAPDNHILDNIVYGNGAIGIYAIGTDRVRITNNTVTGNSVSSPGTYYGIDVGPANGNTLTEDNLVQGNDCRDAISQRGGIINEAGSSRTIIKGNIISKGLIKWFQDGGANTITDQVRVFRKTLSYTDFSAAATTAFVELFTLGPGEKIESVIIKHRTAFTGGGSASYTISVGISSNYTKYCVAQNVFQATGATVFRNSELPGLEDMATGETSIRALATCDINLTNPTAGSVDIWVNISQFAVPVQ